MIKFDKVNLKFGDVVVLDNFSESFEKNKINCILGPSGCGKTTLLNLLSGLLQEQSGTITKPQRVSYVFQEETLISQKTARQNLQAILKSVYKKKAELDAVIDRFFKLVNLNESADLYPHEMSGGMRQRLALIRAFAYPSDILLMDEPFKALDISLRDSIIKEFLSLYEENKRTVLFVTHDIDEALVTGDYIFVYSNKPLTLQNRFEIKGEKAGRKLYDDDITKIKNEIYKETEIWQSQMPE